MAVEQLGARVALVLVQPENPLNVGSVIRIMANFGLSDLRLVEPAAFDPEQTASVPGKARELARSVRRYPDLDAALADCGLVLATSRRPHRPDRKPLDPRRAAGQLVDASQPGGTPAAVLFGCESAGLSRAAIVRAHGIVSIPAAAANPSLNLAQAVAIVAYELFRASTGARTAAGEAPPGAFRPLADGAELSGLFAQVEAVLSALRPRATPKALARDIERLQTILLGGSPRQGEAAFLGRLLEQVAQRLTVAGKSRLEDD